MGDEAVVHVQGSGALHLLDSPARAVLELVQLMRLDQAAMHLADASGQPLPRVDQEIRDVLMILLADGVLVPRT